MRRNKKKMRENEKKIGELRKLSKYQASPSIKILEIETPDI